MLTITAGRARAARRRRRRAAGPASAGRACRARSPGRETRSAVREEMCVMPTARSSSARLLLASRPAAPRRSRAPRSRGSSPTSRRCGRRGSAASSSRRSSGPSRSTQSAISSSRRRAMPESEVRPASAVFEETKYIGRSDERLLGQRRAHRRPPAPRHPRVADGGAAEHPDAQVQPPRRATSLEPRREASPHASASRTQSSSVPPSTAAHSAGVGRLARPRPVGGAQQQRAACSTRAGRRRASGRGRRGRTPTRAARPACRRRRRTSAAAGRAPRAAPSPRAARCRRARTPPPPGP